MILRTNPISNPGRTNDLIEYKWSGRDIIYIAAKADDEPVYRYREESGNCRTKRSHYFSKR